MKKVSLSLLLVMAFIGVLVVIRNVFFVDEFVHVLIEKNEGDEESFDVEGHREFGTFLPKVDVINVTFCDEQVALKL